MIEIVCPNCKARYQLPDGAVGPEGRKVSCSSCSHKWRAFAEVPEVANSPARAASPAPASAPAPVVPPAPAAPAAAAAPAPAADAPPDEDEDDRDDAPPASPMPPPATGDRDEQMAAIRKMLSDLKEAADTVTESPDGAEARTAATAASVGPSARRREDEAPNRSRLEDRIDDVDKLAKMVKGEPTGDGYDAARLRKRHEKRAKRLQRARERKKRSGAFLTGFTLVAVVAAVMVGLYVMHPKIIAASPELGPPLTEYVNTVDRYRVEFAATTEEWKAWLSERIGNLRKQAEEQG